MIRDDAVTRILSRLGNRDPVEYTTIILYEMDDAQRYELEGDASLLPWFMLSESSGALFTPGEERLEIPEDFVMEFEDSPLQTLNFESNRYVPLKKDDWDAIVAKYAESAPGMPKAYALVNQYFRVAPVPDLEYPAKFIYFAQQPLPSVANVENSWLKYAADLLLARTGYTVASKHLQDMELAGKFLAEGVIARARLWRLNEARLHANHEYQMGDD